jgi:uncharacterized protein YcbK (DUF882 family)
LASKTLSDSPLCPPPELQGPDQIDFARRVDVLLEMFPAGIVNSYYRTPEHNADVGGVEDSLHTQGLALDLDLFGADETILTDLGANAVALGLSAIVYWGSGKSYVHVQARPLKDGSRLLTKRT